ncbi:MAG: hypothetical protein O7D86_04125 [Proteobacteria bacterium]|nr:hypothetical protein [Pseudomonadota bacterium]
MTMNKFKYWIIALTFLSPGANALDLSDSKSLLATCTVEDDGYIGFNVAETELEKLFATGRYERTLMSCLSFIHGVSVATSYSGKENYCLPSVSLQDMRSVVVVTLKKNIKLKKTLSL